MKTEILDARGQACPLPVVNTKKKSEAMQAGDILIIIVDNEIAVQNLQKFASKKGFPVTAEKKAEKEYEVTMQITAAESGEEISCEADSRQKGMVICLSANVMGTGDEKLGKALMKAFVFAVTKQDKLPETIVCYNTGAYLTCEGADTLEDMKALEAEGVKILTCGTCLDFYGIKEKLAVGTVTNMYEIVETLEQARQVVRP